MRIAFGLKAHSGWAALVALGAQGGAAVLVERSRLELVAPGTAEWAKQPYHAAHGLEPEDARDVVGRAIRAARVLAVRELKAAVERAASAGGRAVAGAVLVGAPMPAWSVDEILAVHLRMHQAEGFLFRDALAHAVEACGLRLLALPEKTLAAQARERLAAPPAAVEASLATLGRAAGPPWGRDQKDAALAARVALEGAVAARRPSAP
jgi:hypothetical protein